ncbi:MAG: glycosyltransferase family 4 protein [Ignavibacteria bacterium]|nr:glycosyltransferase family 4 protein [Ignavibacteria bacterium]MDH7527617.1 glycosyltransferase family 4 protein [Ignavibacteria bacterium]
MLRNQKIKKIAYIGNYLPRKCGIATFTYDLYHSIRNQYPETDSIVLAITDKNQSFDYPPEVRFEIIKQDITSYQKAADFLNYNNIDIVSLQHEYGIFGGIEGSHILALLRNLRVPVVSTLHTILEEPNPEQKRVLKEIINHSSKVISMTEKGYKFLREIYKVPDEKIDIIPHGIPDMPFVDPNFYKDRFGVEGKFVILTFGLLSPGKGIEYVLWALPKVIEKFPNVVYIILGATHPNIVKEQGESYRLSLERLAHELGIKKNVIFYNRFVSSEELKEFIGAADIYITPYLNKAQITSGTLSYSFGCGKAVISTPYWHAEELLADDRGVLVPFRDSEAIANAIIDLLSNEAKRHSMRKKAYMLGREMVWSNIAHLYVNTFQQARELAAQKILSVPTLRTLDDQRMELPEFNLKHIINLTDSIGIFQHAKFSIPRYSEGYCLDDNARALLFTVQLDDLGIADENVFRLANIYSAFIDYSYNPKQKRFRNFMNFERKWIEEVGSDDSQGRAVWALGTVVGKSSRKNLQIWATQLFNEAIQIIPDLTSPRAWAFGLLGINEYLHKMSGDRLVLSIRDLLVDKLMKLYSNVADADWKWFENYLTYDNAKISQALIVSGYDMRNSEVLSVGIETLKWLINQQLTEKGNFSPIGSEGWFTRGGEKARYDQQPVSTCDAVLACAEAYRITGDEDWYELSRLIFEWFFGKNDLGLPLYDATTGGCYDALQMDRVNLNQGAESTLSFFIALAQIYRIENMVKAYEKIKQVED